MAKRRQGDGEDQGTSVGNIRRTDAKAMQSLAEEIVALTGLTMRQKHLHINQAAASVFAAAVAICRTNNLSELELFENARKAVPNE